MAYKRIPVNKIRKNRIYTITKLATVLGVCNSTVWNWIQKGLPVIDKSIRPWLVDGEEAKVHLEERVKTGKRKMLSHQFHCLKCGEFVSVIANSIRVMFRQNINKDETRFTVRISGSCTECGSKTNRFSTNKKMKDLLVYYNRTDVKIEYD